MTAKIEAEAGAAAAAGKAWKCLLCTYVYDEATGSPAHGIPPGTRLEDLDDDWSCPDCGAGREDFEPLDA